jgi:DHA1 family multidrug resistance protein-like MFS transporter
VVTRQASRIPAPATGIPAGVRLVLLAELAMNAATFMAYPLLAMTLSGRAGLSGPQTGSVLAVFLLSSRLVPVLSGLACDHIGPGPLLVGGAALRAAGFAGLGLTRGFGPLVAFAFVAGLGGAAFGPAVNSVFTGQPQSLRPRIFSIENRLLNAGAVGGPALGAALLLLGPAAPFVGSAAAFAIMTVTLAVSSGRHEALAPAMNGPGTLRANLAGALRNRPFWFFWLAMLPWWFLFSQLGVAIPLRASQLGSDAWVDAIFIANGLVGLGAMTVVDTLNARLGSRRLAVLGYVIVAASFGIVPLLAHDWWLVACVCLFTVGETMLFLASRLLLAGFATPAARATYYGFYSAAWAAGGAFGNFTGAVLGPRLATPLPWLIFGLTGAVAAAVIARTPPASDHGQLQ